MITDKTEQRTSEVEKADEHEIINIKAEKLKGSTKDYDEYQTEKNDKRYHNMYKFPSKWHYFIFLIMFQNSNEMIPIAVRHSLTFSGGGFLLQLIAVGVLIVFPLMYIEIFLGSYAQRTNSQIYKMAPIFFGVTFFIWLYTIVILIIPTIEEAVVLVHFMKRLSVDNYTLNCPLDDTTCYNFLVKPSLQGVECTYNYMSILCEGIGEIRYLSEYYYWRTYKTTDFEEFPRWEIVVAVVIEWAIITFFLTRGLSTLAKIHNFSFIFRIIIYTIIFITAMTKKGSSEGVHKVFLVSTEDTNFDEILGMLAFVMFRSGLIFPVGFMTYSSCLPQRKSMRGESVVICTGGLLVTIFNLMCVFAVMGVLAKDMGVDLSAVYVPYRGIYLAVIPEFLMYYNDAIIFAICYYSALLFPETVRCAIHIHMWILNLYDLVPRYRRNHFHVCLIVCGFFCLFNMVGVYKPLHTIIIPAFYCVHTTLGTMIYLALQMTMICYFYGVNRLTDDIHFLVGYKPNKAGQYVWATFPIVLYVSFFFLRFHDVTVSIEKDMPPQAEADFAVSVMNNAQIAMIIITVLLSVTYVFSKMGSVNTLLTFFKPHYLWGPEEQSERIKRKRFRPRKAIRSQPAPMRLTKLEEKHGKQHVPSPGLEALEAHREQILRSRIFSDSKFFTQIGIPPDNISGLTQTRQFEKIMELHEELD